MNFTERISKKSNLDMDDSISCYTSKDGIFVCAQQSDRVYEIFFSFLNETKPARILEIGTGSGGFTMFLSLSCEELGLDTKIITYDIHKPGAYDDLIKRGVEVNLKNILYGNPTWTSVDDYVIDFIQQSGRTIVLCDGAYKPGEFRVLSQYLKPNDIIMAHDFAENREFFEESINKKIWNWMEIQYSDVKDAMESNNLSRFKKEELQQCVWVAGIKN